MTSIGFTGTQRGMTEAQKASLRGLLDGGAGEFHHGDCVGADAEAHNIADALGYRINIHPPKSPAKRAFKTSSTARIHPKEEYLDRNRSIVRATASLIATPAEPEMQLRSGTWSTVRFALTIGKPVFIIMPDGKVTREQAGPLIPAGQADLHGVPRAEE